jgi:hypothetical protein
MINTIPDGVIKDPRPLEKIAEDYQHISGVVSVNWKELDLSKLNLTSIRNQNGSYSCVFQAGASALEALTGIIISATPYFWRKNYPEKGSWLQDMGDIFYNRYTTREDLSASQNQSEPQMNQLKQLTTFLGITGYRQPTTKNIDQIAEAIESYKQCIVTYESNNDEYFHNGVTPKYLASPITFGHAICAQQYGLINGVKTLVCRDSARNNIMVGVTLITEEFHLKRNTGALYFLGSKDIQIQQDLYQKKITLATQIVALLQQAIKLFKK